MIYLFSGTDTPHKILAYEKFVKSLPKNTPLFQIARNSFNRMQIESLYSGESLFSPLSAVIFQNILEYEETRDFVLDKLEHMKESANYFIFLEGKLNKPILDAFKKYKAEVNVFELPKEKTEKFDTFSIANAFADKNKFNTWLYYRQAVDRGVALEEIVGVLFWKVKDAILKKNFRNFSEAKLKDIVSKLSYLVPEARKNGLDAESVFEQFLLEAF